MCVYISISISISSQTPTINGYKMQWKKVHS